MTSSNNRKQREVLIQRFEALLPDRLDEIENHWLTMAESDWDAGRLRELILRVHILSGSSSMFGYPELGRAAIALETQLESWARQASSPCHDRLKTGASLVAALRLRGER